MTFSDSLTPEESAYCFGLSSLKAASAEDLIKARVNTPGGGPLRAAER